MSIVSQIALSLDLLAQNVQRLQEQAATMPTPAEISTTEGSTKEAAQADYVVALKQYAQQVAKKTELVKLYVQTNAEALQKASEALLKTDGNTSLEARQAAAFIEAAAAAPQDAPGKQRGGPMTERTW
jgi:hypothetical protein